MTENQESTSCAAEDICKATDSDSVQSLVDDIQRTDISDDKNKTEEEATNVSDSSTPKVEEHDEKTKQLGDEPAGTSEKQDDVIELKESVSEPQDEAEVLPRRVPKRGRSLIPRKEKEEAPQNFVDVPDFGYVGIDGSFQSPF